MRGYWERNKRMMMERTAGNGTRVRRLESIEGMEGNNDDNIVDENAVVCVVASLT